MSKKVDNDIDSIIPGYALECATNPQLQQSVQAAAVRTRGREIKDAEDFPSDTVRTSRSDSSTAHRADGPGVPIHSKPANSKQRSRTKQVSVDGNDECAPESGFAQVVCVALNISSSPASPTSPTPKVSRSGDSKNTVEDDNDCEDCDNGNDPIRSTAPINESKKCETDENLEQEDLFDYEPVTTDDSVGSPVTSSDSHHSTTPVRPNMRLMRNLNANRDRVTSTSSLKSEVNKCAPIKLPPICKEEDQANASRTNDSALNVSSSPASPTSPTPKVSRSGTVEDDNDCEDCDNGNDPIRSTAPINESKKCETDENLEQEDLFDYEPVTTDDSVGSPVSSSDSHHSTTPVRPNMRLMRNLNANRDRVTSTSSLKSEVNKCAPIKLPPICSKEDQANASKTNDNALKNIYNYVFDENNEVDLYPDLNRPSEFDEVYLNVSRPYCRDELPKPSPNVPLDNVLKFKLLFGYVRNVDLPWSTSNVGPGGLRYHDQRKKALDFILGKNQLEITDLEAVMSVYRNEVTHFKALYRYYSSLSEDERPNIPKLIQKIANLARRAEEIITRPLVYLLSPKPDEKSQIHTATLSQEQCACLLANAFFCFYPEDDKNRLLNQFNMCELFCNGGSVVKWKFIFHYFQCVTDKMPTGCVTFGRKTMHAEDIPQWDEMDQPIVTVMAVSDEEPIENRHKFLQMDFANKFIGGGVLGSGAVQEEIRFLICPEMLVSMLLCPMMKTNEAIYITGAQRYSSYKGYGNTLEWCPYNEYGHDERDKFGRVINELVAIDAKNFGTEGKREQYHKRFIDRELKKAYIGFHSFKKTASRNDLSPVATGNWGCGVFGGDRKLKSLLQLIAANAARRNLLYVPFQQGKDDAFAKELNYMYWKIRKQKVPIWKLYKLMCAYDSRKSRCLFRYMLDRLRDDDGEATKTDDMEVISAASDA